MSDRGPVLRVFQSAALVFLLDGFFATAFGAVVRGNSMQRVFQGVASVVIGPSALTGGTPTFALGLAMHFVVALTWSFLFLVAVRHSPRLRAVLDSPLGALKVAVFFGPLVWLVMSLAVIPLLVHRMPVINGPYLVMLAGHIIFVGLPIALAIGTPSR
jgi:hypothetical protein